MFFGSRRFLRSRAFNLGLTLVAVSLGHFQLGSYSYRSLMEGLVYTLIIEVLQKPHIP